MRLLARLTAALLVFSAVFALLPNLALADDPLEGLTALPPVGIAVVHDGVDAQGRWTQTIRLTIESGGSLADASLLMYGDESHVNDLFAVARAKNPRLTSPAMIPAGLAIDVPIDPSKTYVLEQVLTSPNTTVWHYTNGVVATAYAKPNGNLSRVISFPDGKPTDHFTYPGAKGPVAVQPGGKLVDLVYLKGQSFAAVIDQVFGLTNYNAAADFAKQTGWNPSNWPPKPGAQKEIVVKPRAVYEQEPAVVQPLANSSAVGQQRQALLLKQREDVGIIPVRLESFGTVYHVAVSDPKLTAADISTLIYGTPNQAAAIAQAAGLGNGATGVAFDPRLFGRAFDLTVDYVDEGFILSRQVDPTGATTVGLVDGAEITNYPPARSGPIRVVRYPTGYARVYYRPPRTLLLVAQGLSFFHVASAPWLSTADSQAVASQYAAQIIWAWGPGLPRSASSLEDSMQLRTAPGNVPYLEVLEAPGASPTLAGGILNSEVLRDPVVAAILLVVLACGVVVIADLARRSLRGFTHPRW